MGIPPFFENVARKLAAKITQQTLRIAYVAGAVVGISRPRDRLAAASEKFTLAPHCGHFVATEPTRLPHDGQIFGRACGRPPKSPLM